MTAVLFSGQYDEVAQLSHDPWLTQLQKTAQADLSRLKVPGRQDEAWRNSPITDFLKQPFLHSMAAPVHIEAPPGVVILPLREAMDAYAGFIKPNLAAILPHRHGFHALNTLMLEHAYFIYIPQSFRSSTPVIFTYQPMASNHAYFARHLVVADAMSELTFLEVYQGQSRAVTNATYCMNSTTELYIAPHARVIHGKQQQESHSAYHFSHVGVKQMADSHFESHTIQQGGRWSRTEMTVFLSQPKANCLLNGLYFPAKNQQMDQHALVVHEMPDCRSEQDYKGVLHESGRAIFNGSMVVCPQAQHSTAVQNNKNLLLSPQAEIFSQPKLDILADDVVCRHGATVGQLDAEALFYFASRGIEYDEAKTYLLQAFIAQNKQYLSQAGLAQWI